ncbi:D-methionine transport system permease protein [Enterococcus sp. PF1-24]|uniref:methionine ABC transporter permease n=1 Tax=unclassified Enterococcus TaxID=2608891 RepID=UPI002476B631|nr:MULTISPECIES: methionine ABC transporter permease [unclassified Enterococcus]MDH6364137.1 D-methionine transport system permease protein [Enterococcus sp. PFB1-1]MDH6401238.1 D-methionine transport system permease protein [Enterococcus sp. PF1-24]
MTDTIEILQNYLPQALLDTAYMVGIATIIGVVCGTLLGLLLYLTSQELFAPHPYINRIASFLVNAIRSLPFLILLVVLLAPITWLIQDPYTATGGAIALSIAAIPFYARIAEGAFSEIKTGVIEAAVATGAKTSLIIREVILPESLPTLIRGVVLTIISLLGYSAMVGTIGAGGIGDLAIQFGYNRYETGVLIVVVLILIVVVQLIQWLGDYLAKSFTK